MDNLGIHQISLDYSKDMVLGLSVNFHLFYLCDNNYYVPYATNKNDAGALKLLSNQKVNTVVATESFCFK